MEGRLSCVKQLLSEEAFQPKGHETVVNDVAAGWVAIDQFVCKEIVEGGLAAACPGQRVSADEIAAGGLLHMAVACYGFQQVQLVVAEQHDEALILWGLVGEDAENGFCDLLRASGLAGGHEETVKYQLHIPCPTVKACV